LDPSPNAAVVGGNVLTSQRLCDVILKAFGACAASQGCMNNLTLGNPSFGYYETICGGAGAGPSFAGRSAVHTHMTNTRIGDPEIIEKRFPLLVKEFSIRQGSGGTGRFFFPHILVTTAVATGPNFASCVSGSLAIISATIKIAGKDLDFDTGLNVFWDVDSRSKQRFYLVSLSSRFSTR
jgi:hypothetical protein